MRTVPAEAHGGAFHAGTIGLTLWRGLHNDRLAVGKCYLHLHNVADECAPVRPDRPAMLRVMTAVEPNGHGATPRHRAYCGRGGISGTVTRRTFVGNIVEVEVTLADGQTSLWRPATKCRPIVPA
jgi:hypothetical protein